MVDNSKSLNIPLPETLVKMRDISIDPYGSNKKAQTITTIVSELEKLHLDIEPKINSSGEPSDEAKILHDDIDQRIDFFAESAKETIEKSLTEIVKAIKILSNWMVNRANVRLIGAGRAKLAGAIPANRLAHGGARVYIIDDLIPMPHSYKQGGIIAVSASGKTPTVIETLKRVRDEKTGIFVIGIADHKANEFAKLCDIFIGIRLIEQPNPLQALADTEEYVISMLLDAMVVAAGRLAGFDDTTWRLGHENIGPSGPYDVRLSQPIEQGDENVAVVFRGRERDLRDLQEWLKELLTHRGTPPNVLCLYGEPGVGKRSLAYRFANEKYVRTEFTRVVIATAYNISWQELVVQIARKVLASLPPKATVSEMEQEILDSAKTQRIFLIIDNVDQNESKLLEFLRRWADARGSSLMLTVQGEAPIIGKLENCRVRKLDGIQEQWVVEDLVGKSVIDRLREFEQSKELDRLGGNPEKLLYLRWRSPETKEEIEACLQDLDENQLVIDPVLKRMSLPLDHFLSLGRIRTTVFDEELLAYIWDRLDRGGTELYTRTLRALLAEGLLEWVDRSTLRMSTSVHAQLWNLAHNSEQGRKQPNVVDYFIAQYFRTRFVNGRPSRFDLEALENYAYHYDCFGKAESACGYIFDAKVIDAALARGLSLEIEPILKHLETGLEDKLRQGAQSKERLSNAEGARLTQMLACVKMNLGHVCKDLSRHEEALEYLDSALYLSKSLDSLPSNYIPDLGRNTLSSEIEHYRGVAYSQVGSTLECIKSYFESVKRAVTTDRFGPLDALSLSYLAYELKFHDMENAQLVARWAVGFSKTIGDRNVCAKSLCNLGQILSFGGEFAESAEKFQKAEKLCEGGEDERTRCRILVDSAVTFIGLGELDKAIDKLDEAIRRFGESGDRRRKSMAKAYQGIILFRKGKKPEGQELIYKALKEHLEAGAQRETIYEALTLVWMAHGGQMPERPAMLAGKVLPNEVREVIDRAINSSRLSVFMDFWENYYLPVLLL